ncbi:MAG TPA: hypothetical protein VIY51_11470 [Xanthobacteraceae bacterium]
MQTVIKADDGDLITVHADDLSIEQLTVRLELENLAYDRAGEFDQLTLSTRRARELGKALIQCADLVERNARKFCGAQHFDFITFDAMGRRSASPHLMMIAGREPPGKA